MSDASMRWLISKLLDKGCGRMAVIVGGGPSAPSDLKKIPGIAQALIISANDHAFKLGLKPEYIWCKDHRRITRGYMLAGRRPEYMEPDMRKYGVPIAGPSYWCDYRAAEWAMPQFNSGQQALAFAVLLGCAPIVPIGMDCFQEGKPTYFHGTDSGNVSLGRREGYWNSRIQKLRWQLPEAPIRGISGLVAHHFGRYDPATPLVPGPLPTPLKRYVKMPTVWVEMRREVQDSKDKFAIIPKDYILPSHKAEADRLIKLGAATRVELFDA